MGKHEHAANIASLYENGDRENPDNYSPISLLNITHKQLMTYIIYKRISSKMDPLLCTNQSGFRKGRSTIDPIYCVRRLQAIVERGKDKLVMLLDSEK